MSENLSTVIVPGGNTQAYQDSVLLGVGSLLRWKPISSLLSQALQNRIRWIQDIKNKESNVSILDMPYRHSARYSDWKLVFQEAIQDTKKLQLIGHSLGASFLIKYLIEHPEIHEKMDEIHLVSTFCNVVGGKGVPSDFQIHSGDMEVLQSLQDRMYFYHAKDDTVVDVNHLKKFREIFPDAHFRHCTSGGHFQKTVPPIYFSSKMDLE